MLTHTGQGRIVQRVRLLDVDVDRIDMAALTAAVARSIDEGRQAVVANHNLHSIRLHRGNAELREFYSQGELIHADGMPVVWIARLLGQHLERSHRTTYVDWFPRLIAAAAERSWRVFYIGSKPGVAERGLEMLRRRFPDLQARAAHGYVDDTVHGLSSVEVIAQINAFRPHLLFVGMGMPRQELWIARHRSRLSARVILPCGAAMDYLTGTIPTPPRWLGPLGLEWLFRLVSEPHRLAGRYLVEPWTLVGPLIAELVRRRGRAHSSN